MVPNDKHDTLSSAHRTDVELEVEVLDVAVVCVVVVVKVVVQPEHNVGQLKGTNALDRQSAGVTI